MIDFVFFSYYDYNDFKMIVLVDFCSEADYL